MFVCFIYYCVKFWKLFFGELVYFRSIESIPNIVCFVALHKWVCSNRVEKRSSHFLQRIRTTTPFMAWTLRKCFPTEAGKIILSFLLLKLMAFAERVSYHTARRGRTIYAFSLPIINYRRCFWFICSNCDFSFIVSHCISFTASISFTARISFTATVTLQLVKFFFA